MWAQSSVLFAAVRLGTVFRGDLIFVAHFVVKQRQVRCLSTLSPAGQRAMRALAEQAGAIGPHAPRLAPCLKSLRGLHLKNNLDLGSCFGDRGWGLAW